MIAPRCFDRDKLPTEICVHILQFLPEPDLARCQRVSRGFHALINAYENFQSMIKCYLAGVTDISSSSQPRHERMRKLKEWCCAWRSQEFTESIIDDISALSAAEHYLSRDVLFHRRDDAGTHACTFIQVPSRSRNIPEKRWQLSLTGNIRGTCVDLSQELFAVLELEWHLEGVLRVRLLCSTTGESHRDANCSSFTFNSDFWTTQNRPPAILHMSISADLLLINIATYRFQNQWTHVFNWKSGVRLITLDHGSQQSTGHLLDDRRLIFSAQNATTRQWCLGIADCYDAAGWSGNPTAALRRTALNLEMPTLKDTKYADEASFTMHVDPYIVTSRISAHYPNLPFHVSHESRVITISMGIQGQLENDWLDFVIPMRTILRHLQCAPGSSRSGSPTTEAVTLPWTEWGEDTRYMGAAHDAADSHGSRLVTYSADMTMNPETTVVYKAGFLDFGLVRHAGSDFNPQTAQIHTTDIREPTSVNSGLLYDAGFLTRSRYERTSTNMSWPDQLVWGAQFGIGEHSLIIAMDSEFRIYSL